MQLIEKYFPTLDPETKERFILMGKLYPEWNEKINVISRKDIDNLYLHHILHSLAIASFLGPLDSGTSFLDMGTGGGFPAIPLATIYPKCTFHLIDRIGKKLRVAEAIAKELGLTNITLQHGDIGECHKKFDYVVSRAVMPLNNLVKLTTKNVAPCPALCKNRYSNGIIALKGGDIEEESEGIKYPVLEYGINEFFNEPFFDSKKIIYIPIKK
ncbi:MAG: 16S rRNA (guanine(527)-N(7))-methyltransferase RsmG [Muribaculaceae bacterium]|nr:16S rRNA (guanine(527)-N(7))-methyltransferase RsmG [Muribaculaceae bacterium]